MSIQVLALFFNQVVCFFVVELSVFYIFCTFKSYHTYNLQIFLPFHRLPFHSVDCVLSWREVFNLMQSNLSIYFCCLRFWCRIYEIATKSDVTEFPLCFLLRVLVIMFGPLIYLSQFLYVVYKVRSNFTFFACGYTVCPKCSVEDYFFPHWKVLALLSKDIWRHMWGLFLASLSYSTSLYMSFLMPILLLTFL